MTQRILQGTTAALAYEHLDSTGALVDASGTMTCAVSAADGSVIAAAGEPTVHVGTGRYTVTVLADETLDLGVLTVEWADSAYPTVVHATEHEVVGGFMFTLAEARAWNNGQLASSTSYPDARIVDLRTRIEDEAEYICGRAFVPRGVRLTLDGTGTDTIATGVWAPRRARTVRVYSSAGSTSYTSLTAGQLAGLVATEEGALRRTDGRVWDWGPGTIVVELEHGSSTTPPTMRDAALIRLADLLTNQNSSTPLRANRYQQADGFAFDINQEDEFSVGIDAVDAVYARHSVRPRKDGKGRPVSRPMQFDPQYWAIFRGGAR